MSSDPTIESVPSDAPSDTSNSAASARWHGVAILAIVALLVALATGTAASRNRPLKVIVPFGAGGGSDTFVRIIQKAITDDQLLDQPLVILNQKGGSGTIGSRTVMTAPADGFTILNLHEAIMTAKLSGKVSYGPEAFEPIAATGRVSMMVIVPADSKYQSLKQMLEEAKAKPDTIGFGANVGAPAHFAGLLLERAVSGAKFRTIQSGGGQQRYTLLIGGHLDMGIFSLDEYINYSGDGKIRALAILDAQSNSAVPNVPTARSQGIDVVHHNTQYWWAPKGTPAEKISAVADVLERAMNSDAVKKQLARTHTEPLFVRGAPLAAMITERMATLGKVDLSHDVDLPDFPLIVGCLVGGLLVVVILLQMTGRLKDEPDATDGPEPQRKLTWAVAAVTLVYVGLLQLRLVRFAIVTTLFILIVGSLLASRQSRRPWLALGEMSLLCGLGLEFVFTRVLVIDLP